MPSLCIVLAGVLFILLVNILEKRMCAMFLEVEAISFAYFGKNSSPKNNQWILHNLSFSVARGDRVGISGPSGKGKSTLLRIIAGLETP